MAKIDKTQYTKQEWRKIRDQRRLEKLTQQIEPVAETQSSDISRNHTTGFILGNGTSRKPIDPYSLRPYGKIYGCNALYRTFSPDYLVAVDVKMILEINKAGYQNTNQVWTNPNKTYAKMQNFNYFKPSKGWSSGPTALWLASQHNYNKIFILGFDYKGLDEGKRLNNLYADTVNYKKSTDGATFFGNWLRQTCSVVKENPQIQYYRVIQSDNYIPEELNKFNNVEHILIEDFQKMFNIF